MAILLKKKRNNFGENPRKKRGVPIWHIWRTVVVQLSKQC
jgi:hypothetical protein